MKKYALSYILLILIVFTGSLWAQDSTGGIALSNPTGATAIATVSNADALVDASDVFYGSNTKGPFLLSWKPVARDSERITVGVSYMQNGVDYDIDYISGMLAFREPVPMGETITVTYKYDPTIATSSKNTLNVPLTLDLYNNQSTKLQFIGNVKQGTGTASSVPGAAIMGLVGNKKSGNTQITSMILLDAAKNNSANADGAAFPDKSAMKFGASTSINKLTLTSSYQRAGTDFDSAKDYQLQQGKEILDLAAAFQANKYLSITSSYKKASDVTDAAQGASVTTTTHGIAYSKEGMPSLAVARTEIDNQAPGANDQKTVTDTLQLQHKLNAGTTAVVSHNDTTVDYGSTEAKSTTDQLSLTSRLSQNLGASAYLKKSDATGVGQTDTVGLNIDNQASRNLSMKLGITRSDNEIVGSDNAETLSLAANPSRNLSAVLGVSHRSSDTSGDELVRNAVITANPLANTKVQLNWQDSQTDTSGYQDVGKLSVETTPVQKLKLAGAIEQKDSGGGSQFNKEARVALTPSPSVTLGGAYIEQETNGDVVARVKEASATVKPIKMAEISSGYKTRDVIGQNPLDTVSLTLSLKPSRIMQLSGSYCSNPETKDGVVQTLRSQSISLNSDFGKLKLRGSYSLNDEYLLGRQSDKTEVGLNLLLSANSSITTGVSVNRSMYDSSEISSEYSLGYNKKEGNNLSLYLGGKVTTYEINNAYMEDMTEYRAEAKIGLKF